VKKEPFTAKMCKVIAEDASRKGSLGDIRLAAAGWWKSENA